jgi:hypothetical protein
MNDLRFLALTLMGLAWMGAHVLGEMQHEQGPLQPFAHAVFLCFCCAPLALLAAMNAGRRDAWTRVGLFALGVAIELSIRGARPREIERGSSADVLRGTCPWDRYGDWTLPLHALRAGLQVALLACE